MEKTMTPPRAGPRALGAAVPLDVGYFTQVVRIIAPDEAVPGETVDIEVDVQNIIDYGFYIAVTAAFDSTQIPITPDYAGVDPGATQPFYGSFVMPDRDVVLTATSYFWDGSDWWSDDYLQKVITRQVLTPQFQGFGIDDYSRT